jgi:hypothetical protein
VGERRHPPGQGRKHVAGPAHRPALERLAPREHQHHEHAGEVFAKQHARHDRDTGEQVGAERAREEFSEQVPDERDPTEHEHDDERHFGEREAAAREPLRGIDRPERHRLRAEREERSHGNRLVDGDRGLRRMAAG